MTNWVAHSIKHTGKVCRGMSIKAKVHLQPPSQQEENACILMQSQEKDNSRPAPIRVLKTKQKKDTHIHSVLASK